MRTCVLSTAQSSEKGDVLNPLITGVFLEVRVSAHMCTHTDKRAHARLLIIVSHLRRPTVRPTSRMPSSCSGPSWRSPTSRGDPRTRTSDQQTPALDPPTTAYTTMITTMIMGLLRKTLFFFFVCFLNDIVSLSSLDFNKLGVKISITAGRRGVYFSVLTSIAVVGMIPKPCS